MMQIYVCSQCGPHNDHYDDYDGGAEEQLAFWPQDGRNWQSIWNFPVDVI